MVVFLTSSPTGSLDGKYRVDGLDTKNGFVDAAHGKGGGYKLNRDASEYKVGEILRLTEGTLAPVGCLEKGAAPCEKYNKCRN